MEKKKNKKGIGVDYRINGENQAENKKKKK